MVGGGTGPGGGVKRPVVPDNVAYTRRMTRPPPPTCAKALITVDECVRISAGVTREVARRGRNLRGMSSSAVVDVQFRLASPALPRGVPIRIRSFGERWVAVARIGEEPQWGLGMNARQALGAALVGLSPSTRSALLADLALLHPSTEIAFANRVSAE